MIQLQVAMVSTTEWKIYILILVKTMQLALDPFLHIFNQGLMVINYGTLRDPVRSFIWNSKLSNCLAA